MEVSSLKTRYSQFDPQTVGEELRRRYGLAQPDCRLFKSGMNDVYLVKTPGKNYYLRISLAGTFGKTDYEQEACAMTELHRRGVNAILPVSCKGGGFVWQLAAPEGLRYAILFEEAIQRPSQNPVAQTRNLGRMIAQLHKVSDECRFAVGRPPNDAAQLVEKPLRLIKPYFSHRQAEYDDFSKAVKELYRFVESILPKEPPYYGFCHGDIHRSNVFFYGDDPAIFDFDLMNYGWRALDVSVYVFNETLSDEQYIEKEAWSAFLEGYSSVRPFSKTELCCISAFAALNIPKVMGLHAELFGRNMGCFFYNDAYFDFFLHQFKLWHERNLAAR